jgi:hypothetical protein
MIGHSRCFIEDKYLEPDGRQAASCKRMERVTVWGSSPPLFNGNAIARRLFFAPRTRVIAEGL